jgi:uncharacterized membrane protein
MSLAAFALMSRIAICLAAYYMAWLALFTRTLARALLYTTVVSVPGIDKLLALIIMYVFACIVRLDPLFVTISGCRRTPHHRAIDIHV